MRRLSLKVLAFVAALVAGTWLHAAPPPNDNLAAPQELTGDSGTVSVDTTEATREEIEDGLNYSSSENTVWYKWTAPKTGIASFDTHGSDFDTILVAYSDLTSFDAVDYNDDDSDDYTSCIEFPANAGQTYLIRVGGYSDSSGSLVLNWSMLNVDVQELTGDSGTVSATPAVSQSSVWYKWTASNTGPAYFRISQSEYGEEEITIYANSVVLDLGYRSCEFIAQAGQTYLVRVNNYYGDLGKFDFRYSLAVPQELTGDYGALAAVTSDSQPTLWYKWTASNTEPMYFDASKSEIYSEITIYTNSVPLNYYSEDVNEFCARAGQTYLIRIDSYDEMGKVNLCWWRDLGEGEWKILAADGVVLTAMGDLPKDLKASDFPAGVTEIAEDAFREIDGMKFVTIPATIKKIGDDAFAYSDDLAWVDYEGDTNAVTISDTAFRGTPYNRELPFKLICKEGIATNRYWNAEGVYVTNYTEYCAVEGFVGTCPDELVIPEGVTRVLSGAFSGNGCEDVTKVTFPSTLRSTEIIDYRGRVYSYDAVEGWAFSGCEALEEVVGIPAAAKISADAFSGSLYEKVRPFELVTDERYAWGAWDYERGIYTNVTTRMWVSGFHGVCPEEVTIPEGIYGISHGAFSLSLHSSYGDWNSLDNLKKVTLPTSISNVDSYAFSYLPNLEEVVFNGKKEEVDISDSAFYGTPYAQKQKEAQPFELRTTYYIVSYVYDEYGYPVYDEYGNYIPASSNLWVTGYVGTPPESIVIPDGVYGINNNVFQDLEGVTSVTIPASVKEIGSWAFAYCEDLATVTFLGKKEEINRYYEGGLGMAFLGTPYSATLDFQVLYSIYPATVWHYEPVYNEEYGWDVDSEYEYSTNCYVYGYVGTCPAKLDLSQLLTNKWGYTSFDAVSFNQEAFAGTEALTELVLPKAKYYNLNESYTWVGEYDNSRPYVFQFYSDSKAFRYCPNLATVTIAGDDANNKAWLTDAFQGTPWLDKAVPFEFITEDVVDVSTNFDEEVVGDCNVCAPCKWKVVTNVTTTTSRKIVGFYGNVPSKLTFPEDVDEIDVAYLWKVSNNYYSLKGGIFEGCKNLTEVVVPGNVKAVGQRAFAGCDNLQSVEFEEGVESIGYSLFYGCGDGMQVILPASSVVGHYVVDEDALSDDDALTWRGARIKWSYGSFNYDFVFNGIDGDVDVVAPRTDGIYDRAFLSGDYFGRTCVEYYTLVHLDANGGTFEGDADYRCFDDVVTDLPTPTLAGNVFREWWTLRGGRFYRNGDEWDENTAQVYLKAEWATEQKYAVYGLEGPTEISLGNGDDYETLLRVLADMYGAEPEPSRHGLTFRYWTVDGVELNHRSEIGANSAFGVFFDEFNPLTTGKPESAVDASAAQTYDGYILDYKGNNAGTIQVKVGKPNAKTGEASISAKVQMFGTAKISFKAEPKGKWKIETGGTTKGVTLFAPKATDKIVIDISEKGIFGTYGAYDVIGSRNTSKKDAAYANWSGKKYDVVFKTKEGTGSAFTGGYSGVTVSIASKGKVKITGVMADGAKVNASAQLLISDKGEGCVNAFVPMYTGKKGGFGFVLWIAPDFSPSSVESISTWTSTNGKAPFTAELELVDVAVPAPTSEMSFALETEPVISGATVLSDYLPKAVKTTFDQRKFTIAKANTIKVDKTGTATRTGAGRAGVTDNDAGLKLTYTVKTGAFKGSFTVFTLVNGKLKKVKATVNGVFVKGVGYGSALIKNVGAFPVTVR